MLKNVKTAYKRLKGVANITPILTSRTLHQILGAEIYFKCEKFQGMGAFKFRGAYNCISQLTDDEKARGVVIFFWQSCTSRCFSRQNAKY